MDLRGFYETEKRWRDGVVGRERVDASSPGGSLEKQQISSWVSWRTRGGNGRRKREIDVMRRVEGTR